MKEEMKMYSKESTTNGSNTLTNELRWVIQIRRTLDDALHAELEEEDGVPPVTIFRIPTTWLDGKPECYQPQLVGLGPYHRWRPEFHGMECYKLSAARSVRKGLPPRGLQFQHIVDQLVKLEHRLRASYHGYLDYNGEMLAWGMALDAAFVLEFLRHLLAGRGEASGKMSQLVDFVGRRSTHNMVLRDLIVLENQIPLWVLRKILEAQESEGSDELLSGLTAKLVKELCPFEMADGTPRVDVSQASHLLELLYNVIVPKLELCRIEEVRDQVDEAAASDGFLWQLLACLRQAISSRPVKLLRRIITNLPALALLRHFVEQVSGFPRENRPPESRNDADAARRVERPLLAEEISIPSVTDLAAAGVRFSPAPGGPASVAFDEETVTLRLPAVSLDVNTEVTLRNLVAHEASSPAEGPPVLARYVELMNGVVDGAEDVRVLREAGVVRNRMRSDGEAAELWNGMGRWAELGRVAPLDRAIEGVNRYYGSRWRVKVGKLLRERGGPEACSCTAVLAAVLLLALMSVHAFCLFTNCARPKSAMHD